MIANDLDPRHLEILKATADPTHRHRLHLRPGRMPQDLAFLPETFDAVLSSRMINFIPPDHLQTCFDLIYQWLCPRGKFFFLGGSPYSGTYAAFLSQYQDNKQQGLPWPGHITDMRRYTQPSRVDNLPDFVTLLDQDEVTVLLETAGFEVESIAYVAVDPDNPAPMKRDGREYIGAIGVKS